MQLSEYSEYLTSEKRYSPHTVKSYLSDIEQFSVYLNIQYQIDDISKAESSQIRSWMASLINEKLNSRSVHRKLSTLRNYFKYLMRHGYIDSSPLETIVAPKTKKRLPQFIDESKIDELLDVEFYNEGFEGVRDNLILKIFYATGIRLAELINIKDSDIDFSMQNIKVKGKRNKERIIPIGKGLINAIEAYIKLRDETFEFEKQNPFLLVTIKGNQLYPKSVYRIVRSNMGRVTTQSKKSPHILRHTFATHLLNEGADINAIKDLLGHANLSATQVYTHNTIGKLKKIYKQAHPRA